MGEEKKCKPLTLQEKNTNKISHKLIHYNVQSLYNVTMELSNLLEEHKFSIACITEHWQDTEQLKLLKISNYKLAAHCCRPAGKHGRVAIYCLPNYESIQRNDIKDLSIIGCLECAAADINIE